MATCGLKAENLEFIQRQNILVDCEQKNVTAYIFKGILLTELKVKQRYEQSRVCFEFRHYGMVICKSIRG